MVMDMIGGLLGGLGGLGGGSAPRAKGFNSWVSVSDGDTAYDTGAEMVALIGAAGVWKKIWEMTVPAQQMLRWGHGFASQPENQGYMWFAMLDINVDWSVGILRLAQANARETRTEIVGEVPDSQLHSTTVTTLATAALLDRKEMIALPEKIGFPMVGEDSKLQLFYKLITAATAVEAGEFKIPVTIYQ